MHAELLHDAAGGMVLQAALGVDAMEMEGAEGEVQHGHADLGSQALAGVVGIDTPADLALLPAMAANVEEGLADDVTRGFVSGCQGEVGSWLLGLFREPSIQHAGYRCLGRCVHW